MARRGKNWDKCKLSPKGKSVVLKYQKRFRKVLSEILLSSSALLEVSIPSLPKLVD